jgi:hypothetical protein
MVMGLTYKFRVHNDCEGEDSLLLPNTVPHHPLTGLGLFWPWEETQTTVVVYCLRQTQFQCFPVLYSVVQLIRLDRISLSEPLISPLRISIVLDVVGR